jgi:hypothetical protein
VARVEREVGPVALVRLDAGFPSEHLLGGLEGSGIDYVARIKKNQVLDRLAGMVKLPQLPPPVDEPRLRFREIEYQAGTWSRARRVVYVHIQQPGELFGRDFFLITSIGADGLSGEELLARYRERGRAEDAMGQFKQLIEPLLSSTNRRKTTLRGQEPERRSEPVDPFANNEVELLLGALAAGLVRALERIQADDSGRHRRLRTVREQMLKVGARVTLTGRYVVVSIAGSARETWQTMWRRLERFRWDPAVGPAG